MARAKGISISSTYDVAKKQPLDARMLVSSLEDLINPQIWIPNGLTSKTCYKGMLTAVSNLGIYYLLDDSKITTDNYIEYKEKEQLGEDTSQYFNMWVKLCSIDTLDQIQEDLAQIKETISTIDTENLAKVVQLDNTINLPSIGDINTVYFIRSKNATYRWDQTDGSYKCCGTGNDYTSISTISGGNASSIF